MTVANARIITAALKDWIEDKGFQFDGFGVYTHGIWLCDLSVIESERNAGLVAIYSRYRTSSPQFLSLASPDFYTELTNFLDTQRTSYWSKNKKNMNS